MPDDQQPEASYSNIRKLLGKYIGKRVVDITQHDEDEWAEDQQAYVMLMFEDGGYIQFFIGDEGFISDQDAYEAAEDDSASD